MAYNLAFWRAVTAFTLVNVKESTREAKQASLMTMVYHNLVYIVFFKILGKEDSMITKAFADQLTQVKSDAQMEQLVNQISTEHFPSAIKSNWKIPVLEEMELEVMFLASYWNDCRVSKILFTVNFTIG